MRLKDDPEYFIGEGLGELVFVYTNVLSICSPRESERAWVTSLAVECDLARV
jgi:hypothetical protein